MKTIDRLINAYIQGSYLRLDGKMAGVQGESRMKTLRLHLSPEWLELTKKVLFMDAKGQNPVSVLLSSEVESYVNGTELVFDVLIPGDALAEAGECTFIVSGTGEDRQGYSVQGHLKVLPNDFYDVEPGNASTPTPSEMEQLQGYMDDILRQAGESTKEAVEKSEAAATRAENAQTAAETARSAAETARAAAESAKTAAESAKTAAESAQNAAETAKSGAETARATAEAAATAAKNQAEEAAKQASVAAAAATRAETALNAVQTNASNAQTAAQAAQSAASEAVTAKLAAQSAANSAAGYADAAAAAATRAENAQTAAEAAQSAAETAKSEAEQAANRAEGYTSHPPVPTEDGQFWQLWDGEKYVTTEYPAAGEDGHDGDDGISPTVVVEQKDYGYEVTITDLSGAKTFTIWNGEDGEPGASGGINNLWYVDRIGKELAGEVASVVSELQSGDDATWAGRTPAAGDMVIARKDGMLLTISSIFSKDLFGTEEDRVGYGPGNGYIEGYPAKVTVGFTNEYDFVCDGADDQETINLAISTLPDHGGTVILGPGTYHLTGRIHSNAWKSDDTRRRQRIVLKGQQIGGNVTTGSATEVILQRDYTTHAGAAEFNGLVALNAEEICLENLTLYGAGGGSTRLGNAIGAYATGTMPTDGSTMFSRLDVKNCRISDFWRGVVTNETFMGTKRRSAVRLENSRIENCTHGTSVFSYLEAEGCRVKGCEIGIKMLSGKDTAGSKVRDNVFLDNEIAIQVYSDEAVVSGNFVSRGTGLAEDFTDEQHTIMLGTPTTSTNPKGAYPQGAWICGNKLVGKAVSYAGDPLDDTEAENMASCRVLGNE